MGGGGGGGGGGGSVLCAPILFVTVFFPVTNIAIVTYTYWMKG